MRFLIIGLGSMGKRRIRCLINLGIKNDDIYGFDIREDRKQESQQLYGIKIVNDIYDFLSNIDAVIISTPPDRHHEYMELAIEHMKPVFVEASVILKGLEDINEKAREKQVFVAPSCTMYFHPLIQDINYFIKNKIFGKITNFSYHSGQYLPDWHPWESIHDFYVSKKETGGAREIVPFELTWITKIMGFPEEIKGYFSKTMDLGCDIDDTYAVCLKFRDFLGSILVDVVSRKSTRKFILNFEYGQAYWDWYKNALEIFDAKKNRELILYGPMGTHVMGYNKNIIEEMYIEEINRFIKAIKGEETFPHTLDDDIKVLKLLQELEGGILP